MAGLANLSFRPLPTAAAAALPSGFILLCWCQLRRLPHYLGGLADLLFRPLLLVVLGHPAVHLFLVNNSQPAVSSHHRRTIQFSTASNILFFTAFLFMYLNI